MFSLTLTLSRREKELLFGTLCISQLTYKVSSGNYKFPRSSSFSLRERVRVRENIVNSSNQTQTQRPTSTGGAAGGSTPGSAQAKRPTARSKAARAIS